MEPAKLNIVKAQVIKERRIDKVVLFLDPLQAKPPFPMLSSYKPTVTIECARGYGATWVRESLHIEPEVIDILA